VRVNGRSATIVGVVPKEFGGLYAGVEMDGYLPLNSLATVLTGEWQDYPTNRTRRLLTLVGGTRGSTAPDTSR
jgi:hypothetical protein